jgi:20S proteasome subunit beta 1
MPWMIHHIILLNQSSVLANITCLRIVAGGKQVCRIAILPLLLVTNHETTTLAITTEVDLGTTLVALKYDNGVVVGADTRTSVSDYVSNKLARKIDTIVSTEDISCVVCRSGSAADTQWLCQETSKKMCERTYRYRQVSSVSQVAHFLKYLVKQKQEQLQASLICAGCDSKEGGRIFWIASSGTLWEEDVFCVSGSGSTFLLGHLDSLQLTTENFYSQDEAVALVTKLLRLSIARDGSSGGLIRLMIMRKGKGIEEVTVYPEPPEQSAPELPGFASVATTAQ